MKWGKTAKVVTLVVAGAIILTAIYIMVNGLGLQDSLDFGAGAYYYADIPEFDKYTESATYATKVPYWIHVVLFLVWGAAMFGLWKWIDKK